MERQIQVNDFVLISRTGFTASTYIIRKIDQNGIYISSNANPGGWKIYGSEAVYTIQFQDNPNTTIQAISSIQLVSPIQPTNISFSGVKDIDFVILSQLDDISLANACAVNKYVASLCREDWHLMRYKYHFDRFCE